MSASASNVCGGLWKERVSAVGELCSSTAIRAISMAKVDTVSAPRRADVIYCANISVHAEVF
jgi:hypothetical protein